MIFGMPPKYPLPDNWTPLEAIAIVKCLDKEGDPRLAMSATTALNQWEAVGMLLGGADVARAMLSASFLSDDEPTEQ